MKILTDYKFYNAFTGSCIALAVINALCGRWYTATFETVLSVVSIICSVVFQHKKISSDKECDSK